MYLLTWNAEQNTIHAGVGGVVTSAESQVLGEELSLLLQDQPRQGVRVELDTTKATRMVAGAQDELEKLAFLCAQYGAKFHLIREEEEPMSANVRAILEDDRYEVFALSRAS